MKAGFRSAALAAVCGCVSNTTDSGDTEDTDTTPPTTECEVFDLAMWCHNTENGGPDPAVPDCPVPTVDSLLAETSDAWSGLCDSPTRGPLTVVNQATGYGGPFWYFDSTDTFVAYRYTTDINVYCDGTAFSVSYGFEPDCQITCVYTDPGNVNDLPEC